VSVEGGAQQPGAAPPLPSSIWVVAWASLAGQVVLLAWQGVRPDDEVSLVLSVVLGALLVGYVSAGVVRARTVRLAFAWVVLVLSLIAELVGLVSVDDLAQAALVVLSLATTALALAGLARFRRTEWYAWQRMKPSAHEGARIGQLVAMGVLVGVLGGLIGPVDDGLDVRTSVADR
jgi:peptidoglycan/LPS O-acetylase OafA/YrhL